MTAGMLALWLFSAPATRGAPPMERPVHHILPRKPSHPVKLPPTHGRRDRHKQRVAKN
ncbi:MAG: hypothetical protein JST54_27395 [Deltaproteobacteria bacterium]|nr:hypothetical protein [Deltaproteobacteria bacterium]